MLIVNMMEDLGEGAGAEVPIPNVRPIHFLRPKSRHRFTSSPISSPTPASPPQPQEYLKEKEPQLTRNQVNESVLKKVIEWCEHHKDDPPASADDSDSRKKTTDIEEWDQKFMQVDQEMLFEIILASNYLDIKPLLDVGCKTVANMIKGKSPEEIRKTFNITNDFTPEEEDQIRRRMSGLRTVKGLEYPRGSGMLMALEWATMEGPHQREMLR